MSERRNSLVDYLRDVGNTVRSKEMRDDLAIVGLRLYGAARWTLATVLHPIATFRAVMLTGGGDEAAVNRNAERALSLPGLPIGRQRFHH